MKNLRIYQLIHRDLTHQLSHKERLELKAYKNASEYDYIFAELSAVWTASKEYFPNQKFDVTAAKAKFMQRIKEETPAVQTKTGQASIEAKPEAKVIPMMNMGMWRRVAVAAVVVIGVTTIAYNVLSSKTNIISAGDDIQYAILEDQSEVWLNKGASLTVSDFDKSDVRMVSLEGEAYFDIASDKDKLFIIDLGAETYVEVIGTAFNVSVDKEQGLYKVDVNKGIVKFYNATNDELSFKLYQGETGKINLRTISLFKEDHAQVVSFLTDELSFKNAPLSTVFDKVGKFFDVTIEYDRTGIQSCLVNSPLMDEFGLEDIFAVLKGLYPDLKIDKTGKKKYLARNLNCGQPQ